MAVPYDPTTFDPYAAVGPNNPVLRTLNDTLVRYDARLQPQPRLATAWQPAADGTSITVTLREHAKFQTGAPIDSAALMANLKKAADKDLGLNLISLAAGVKDYAAVDGQTVTINFTTPQPPQKMIDFLEALPLVDPAGIETLKTKPAGAGPFKLDQFSPGQTLALSRFDGYWDPAIPQLDKAGYRLFTDPDAAVSALQSGGLDMIAYIAPADAARLGSDFNVVPGTPGSAVFNLRVHPLKPPFDNKLARQAMQYVWDRAAIARTVMYGFAEPTVLPFSKASAAFDPTALAQYPYDLQKARSLLMQAGVVNGSAELITSMANPILVQLGTILQAELAKIGFTMKLTPLDDAEATRRLLAGDFVMTLSGLGNTNIYPTWLTSNSVFRVVNNPIWGDQLPKTYIDAVRAADMAITPDQQKTTFTNLRNVILDESWVIVMATLPNIFALSKKVSGFDFTVQDMLLLDTVKVAA